jgi:hypothetical protein
MPHAEFPGTVVGKTPGSHYSTGRPYGALIWIVIHSTEGSETPTAAEDGNAYDARRTDETSTHVFADSNTVVQEINSGDRAWAARTVANNRGYQVELCGKAAQSIVQWKDAASLPELELAAKHCAYVAHAYGIPPRWCTKADVDARRPGFMTHAMVTEWIEGTHTDPGANFPFAWFLSRVAYYISLAFPPPAPAPVVTPTATTPEENDVALIKLANSNDVYATVPGVGYYHIANGAELADLKAAFGNVVTVKNLGSFGKEVASPVVAKKLGAFEEPDDTQADDEGLRGEHDPGDGPQ